MGESWRTSNMGANARGYTYQWQQASKAFLRLHPLCQCPACDEGRVKVTLATIVDHIDPHRGDMVKFWDQRNWQALSKPCHDGWKARHEAQARTDRVGGAR
jgi:5-methylcytosine-specific restriction enzyme A